MNHSRSTPSDVMQHELRRTIEKHLAYCRACDLAGHDPYDALNSRLFDVLPFLDAKPFRLVLTQALKRSPVDFRRLLLIPKTQNPKALSLFLSAFLKLSAVGMHAYEDLVDPMIEKLITLRSPGTPYWCWGYSFPWQTRTFLVPRGAPNLVCTVFVADALLNAYEWHSDDRCLAMAVSAAEYLVKELYWCDGYFVGFSYPQPGVPSQVSNANLLAAALLSRVYNCTGDGRFRDRALEVARCSAAQQNADGSWYYGQEPSQRWIDNFHTGYNLCALRSISRHARTSEFDERTLRGFDFYRTHFVRDDGAVAYFHDRSYPIDIHCVAQTILTLVEFSDVAGDNSVLAASVWRWAMTHLWDKQGFFYYRRLQACTIRTSYMRWSQAWMFSATVTLLQDGERNRIDNVCCRLAEDA